MSFSRASGAVDQARLARGLDVAPQLDGERIHARNVERLERQLRRASKLVTAAGEKREDEGGKSEAHRAQTTTFTRRPGTTTTFFTA
jgi:hypothetical protein